MELETTNIQFQATVPGTITVIGWEQPKSRTQKTVWKRVYRSKGRNRGKRVKWVHK